MTKSIFEFRDGEKASWYRSSIIRNVAETAGLLNEVFRSAMDAFTGAWNTGAFMAGLFDRFKWERIRSLEDFFGWRAKGRRTVCKTA